MSKHPSSPAKKRKSAINIAHASKPSKAAVSGSVNYGPLLVELKSRVRTAQMRAVLAVNSELVLLYWQIGHLIAQQQAKEGWGAGVIPRLAADLHTEFPEMKGFSERNIKRMLAFAREYPVLHPIVPQAAAQVPEGKHAPVVPQSAAQLPALGPISVAPQIVAQVPWFHHVILMEKVKDRATRIWYMHRAVEHGWSRTVLTVQIETKAHNRAGKAVTNFAETLPPVQSDLAQQALKDPYTFAFFHCPPRRVSGSWSKG